MADHLRVPLNTCEDKLLGKTHNLDFWSRSKRLARWIVLGIAFAICFAAVAPSSARATIVRKVLPIAPVRQYSSEWCWLAVLQMIFQYHHVPDGYPATASRPPDDDAAYQLDIVARSSPSGDPCKTRNIFACAHHGAGANEGATKQIIDTLASYPPDVGSSALSAASSSGSLTSDDIISEINARRPIIAGINPDGRRTGGPDHAVLIVGYRQVIDSEGQETKFAVYVNDPYDYDLAVRQHITSANPWDQISTALRPRAYQYLVPLNAWTSTMAWVETIDLIEQT